MKEPLGSPTTAASATPAQINQYRILARIGEGGMGAVYKARDENLGRIVALKLLALAHIHEQDRLRFRREARTASSLNHPNIITIYDFGQSDGVDFLAMEFVEGDTLRRRMHGESRDPLPRLLGYAHQAALGIARAHAGGVIHRDLKPGNIMVTRTGLVKVLDFGLAKMTGSPDPDQQQQDLTVTGILTVPGGIFGTPAYMSPEQSLGEPLDHRSDIFSFGAILFEIACGRKPFEGGNSQVTLQQIAVRPAPRITEFNPAAPEELAVLVDRCLQKSPEHRPQSMDEVAGELERILASAQTPAPPEVPPPAPAAPHKNRRTYLVAAAAILVAGIAGLLAGLRPWHQPVAPAASYALTYAIETQAVQQDGKPAGEPVVVPPRGAFQGGWRFRLRVQPAGAGHVYLINRGPDPSGSDRYWILYPPAALETSQTLLPVGQPSWTGWFVFDQTPGTERLWIVWSRQPLAAIESRRNNAPIPIDAAGPLTSLLDRLEVAAAPLKRTENRSGAVLLQGSPGQEVFGEKLELTHQ
jgi:tRNA A-37 threonylcarbamoyl transferase component Bud32